MEVSPSRIVNRPVTPEAPVTESIATPHVSESSAMKHLRPAVVRPFTLFFTGLPASGKTTIATAVRDRLDGAGIEARLLDGDEVRRTVSADLGFSREDRIENIRRIGKLAAQSAEDVSIVAAVSPSDEARLVAREAISEERDFVLVWMATPRDVCEGRDPKGLYARARAGEIENFTGVSQPYESPADADLEIDTTRHTIDESVDLVLDLLRRRELLTDPTA